MYLAVCDNEKGDLNAVCSLLDVIMLWVDSLGDARKVTGSLKEVESTLFHCPEFMRGHRSYIVNMFQVERLSSAGLRTFQGESLPVSHLLYPGVQKDYFNLLFEGRKNS